MAGEGIFKLFLDVIKFVLGDNDILSISFFAKHRNVIAYLNQPKPMKRTLILLILILTTVATLSQQNKSVYLTKPESIIDSLNRTINRKLKVSNPKLILTNPSFFDSDNENKYFVSMLQISGNGIPFTWDMDFKLINFLMALDKEVSVKKGISADPNYEGTKIIWDKNINGLVWFNDKTYRALVDYWHLFSLDDCPGTTIFPTLRFKKLVEIPNAVTNRIEGLTIFPYNENIKVKRINTAMKTENGKIINGFGYDLNNDHILDIFTYNEDLDEVNTYQRLYVNVSGKWKLNWVNLQQICTD